MNLPVLVGCDRDGTVNLDENYYLGSQRNWKDLVQILPGVVEGIRLINSLDSTYFFILTNQSGVALTGLDHKTGKNYGRLTEAVMHEVNKEIIRRVERNGAKITGYFACPFVNSEYARKAILKHRKVNPDYIDDSHPDIKPRPGMIDKAIDSLSKVVIGPEKSVAIYSVGDRNSDVQMGINAGGKGVLVVSPKTEERGDRESVENIARENPGRVYIASDFLDGARWIYDDVKAS